MSLEAWLAFAAASAVLLVIPGPAILTVISYSVAHGGRANAPLVAAVALGDSTALVLSLLGLGALLAASAFAFTGAAALQCRRGHAALGRRRVGAAREAIDMAKRFLQL